MVHSQTTQFAIGPLSLETIITEKKKTIYHTQGQMGLITISLLLAYFC